LIPWHIFAKPGEVFKFLKKNHVCYMIDMGELPPMDLIQDLLILSEKIKRKTNPDAYKEVSDLVSMLVAASAREPLQMLNEIVIRDQNVQLSKELDEFLAKSSYIDQEHKEIDS
jgi:hypothetical protein